MIGHGEELRAVKKEGEEASALLDALRPGAGVEVEQEEEVWGDEGDEEEKKEEEPRRGGWGRTIAVKKAEEGRSSL